MCLGMQTNCTSEGGGCDGVAAEMTRELSLNAASLPHRGLLLLPRGREGRGRGTHEGRVPSLPEGVAAEECAQSSASGRHSDDELSRWEVEQDLLQQLRWKIKQVQHLSREVKGQHVCVLPTPLNSGRDLVTCLVLFLSCFPSVFPGRTTRYGLHIRRSDA